MIKKTNIDDVLFYNMRTIIEQDGNLVPIESNGDVPFPIRRVFYVYGVRDSDVRGQHSHFKTKQLLICIHLLGTMKNQKRGKINKNI